MNGARKSASILRRMVMIVMTGHDPVTLTAPDDVRRTHEERLEAAEERLAALDARLELENVPEKKLES